MNKMTVFAAFAAFGLAVTSQATTYYVSASRPNNSGNGLSWSSAKKTIQAAVNLAKSGDTVLVNDGTYDGFTSNNKNITIKSLNGSAKTKIKSAYPNWLDLGAQVKVATDTYVKYTDANGYEYNEDVSYLSTGGAITATRVKELLSTCGYLDSEWASMGRAPLIYKSHYTQDRFQSTGTATKVVGFTLTGVSGPQCGTYRDCVISNIDEYGVGVRDAVLERCTVSGNGITTGGGLIMNSTVNDCLIKDNTLTYWGCDLLSVDSTLNRCRIEGNQISVLGDGSALFNCLIADNEFSRCVFSAWSDEVVKAYNCTFARNRCADSSLYADRADVRNCIFWDNDTTFYVYNYFYGAGGKIYNCVGDIYASDPSVLVNCKVGVDPLFVNAAKGDYRLRPDSPCRDAGSSVSGIGAKDLAGKPRKTGSALDVGCYEYAPGVPVHGDYDGDGVCDCAYFYEESGAWIIRQSRTRSVKTVFFGWSGCQPVPADYDGDGVTDIAIVTPAWEWKSLPSKNPNTKVVKYGWKGCIPVPADYDGDGKADIAIVTPSWQWKSLPSKNPNTKIVNYGWKGCLPIAADYDGDGKTDIAILSSDWRWKSLPSKNPNTKIVHYGWNGCQPMPADYDGDGKADLTVVTSAFQWRTLPSKNPNTTTFNYGWSGCQVLVGDFDGDGKADPVVLTSAGEWRIMPSKTKSTQVIKF